MTTLQGFYMVPQRTQVTGDGKPSNNPNADCVAASICAGAMYLNGIHQLGGQYDPDAFKDAAYSEAYTGTTAAYRYKDYCASLGIKLWNYDSASNAELVAEAHQQIQAGHPVVFTIPNIYGDPSYTHVCVFFSEDSTAHTLTCMDPWIAEAVTKTDAEWEGLLRYNQVWVLERSTMIPTNWHDNGSTLTAPNGIAVVRGFRDYILSRAWDPNNYPLQGEQAREPLERSNVALGAGTRQVFRLGALEWTATKGVFPGWIGQELLEVEKELAAKGA